MTKKEESKIFMSAVQKGKQLFQIPCVDVYPEKDDKNIEQSKVFSAITMTNAIWKAGSSGTITITFGGYGCEGCSPDAAWSMIGNQSTTAMPSMNLGFIDPPYEPFMLDGVEYSAPEDEMRNYCGPSGKSSCHENWKPGATVIHEFCHAIGMLHEHQNNLFDSNTIKLNKEAVVQYYERIGMGEQAAQVNVLDRYECSDSKKCEYAGTKYDKKSIMLYYLPDDWIDGKNPTYPNFELSDMDKGWLKSIYPMDINNFPKITLEYVDTNIPEWKQAWIKKVIRETFDGLIGIDIKFKDNLKTKNIPKKAESDESTTTRAPTRAPTGAPTREPTRAPTRRAGAEESTTTRAPVAMTLAPVAEKKLSAGEIIGIVIGVIALLVAIYFYNNKKQKSSSVTYNNGYSDY
jgi:hypothetical protein